MVFHVDILSVMYLLVVLNASSMLFMLAYLKLTGSKGGIGYFSLSKLAQCLSWVLALHAYLGRIGGAAIGLSDLFLVLGIGLETALFVSFLGGLGTRGRRLAYFGLLSACAFGVYLLARPAQGIKNLLVLASYLGFAGLAAWRLLFGAGSSPFRRLLGFLYGTVPLVSSVLFVRLEEEVTVHGAATSSAGLVYYAIITAMQLVGSVGYLLMVKESTELELAELASKDSLTGILNRRAFYDRAELLAANSARAREPLSAILMDLDHFKAVNDAHGHQVGDRVIQAFCQAVGRTVRRGDLFARFGGEEFLVFLPSAGRTEALAAAERIKAELGTRPAGLPAYTVSFGVATAAGGGPTTLDRLIGLADEALYAAKEGGRDRIEWRGIEAGALGN